MEKFRIWTSLFFRAFVYHLVYWYLALLFYLYLTGDSSLFNDYFEFINLDSVFLNILYLASILSLIFTIIDSLFSDRILRQSPIRFLTIIKSLFYFLIVTSIFILSAYSFKEISSLLNPEGIYSILPEFGGYFLRFLLYFYVACFFNSFISGMVKRIGRLNYWKWLMGFMNKPREEERIFMFVDMTSSTTIAEKLGHKKFSYLVQDVFNDMAIVDNYNGHIYQYLGDGAIISWDLKSGLKNVNCLKAFFAFEKVVKKRRRSYNRKYGFVPEFKAGLHVGKIMVLQVGTIRRDISYNGDTLNTTARIESMCNTYKRNLLISGELRNKISKNSQYSFKNLGKAQLKGKKEVVDIFDVKEKSKN
jgi:adenylate cyclase